MQAYFEVTPPSVHRMVVELERKGLITRVTSPRFLLPVSAISSGHPSAA